MNAWCCLHLRVAWRRQAILDGHQQSAPAQKDLGRVIIPAPAFPTPSGDQRGASMCKTLKTDIKLFAAAIVAAALVLGANVSLADIVSTLGGAN
ncbi:hypothetical protein [Mesorhizobium loti]|nr:hypothetical protein [Mesorhizobium loti]